VACRGRQPYTWRDDIDKIGKGERKCQGDMKIKRVSFVSETTGKKRKDAENESHSRELVYPENLPPSEVLIYLSCSRANAFLRRMMCCTFQFERGAIPGCGEIIHLPRLETGYQFRVTWRPEWELLAWLM
jgi:hypothetical protein